MSYDADGYGFSFMLKRRILDSLSALRHQPADFTPVVERFMAKGDRRDLKFYDTR